MGGPSILNMSGLIQTIHVHVLGMHINHFGIVMSWTGYVDCWHLLRTNSY